MEEGGARPALPLRAFIPWWFVAGAVLTIVLTGVVPLLQYAGGAVVGWGVLIAIWMRTAREGDQERAAEGRPPARVVAGVQACLALAGLAALVGTGLVVAGVSPHRFDPDGLVAGGALLLVSAVLAVVAGRWARHRRASR